MRGFVVDAIAARLQAESLVVEFKQKAEGSNVVEAVAALANSNGGLIFVGVAEGEVDPFVGITAKQVDSIVQQLRSLLPDAMPEVVPVALADKSGRALLVLRVDADAVEHPVVLNGKVWVRVPGHSVGARREEILSLFNRAATNPLSGSYAGMPVEVTRLNMWDDSAPVSAEVRVHATFRLPRSIAGREWLGTPAIRAAEDALEAGPVPWKLLSAHLREQEFHASGWQKVEVAAVRARFRSEANPSVHRGRPRMIGSTLLSLAGRTLDVVVSTAIAQREDGHSELLGDARSLRELLLGGAVSAVVVGRACAEAMDAPKPLAPPMLSAWIGGDPGLQSIKLDQDWVAATKTSSRTEWRFTKTCTSIKGVDDGRDFADTCKAMEWCGLSERFEWLARSRFARATWRGAFAAARKAREAIRRRTAPTRGTRP